MTAFYLEGLGLPMTAEEVLNNFLPYGQRILITGCQGLLGQKLRDLLAASNSVVGVDLTPQTHLTGDTFRYLTLDITNRDQLVEAIAKIGPSFVINTAAMTDVDGCEIEKDRCWRINVLAVENLIRACQKADALLIQISSDYVFDGRHAPYGETDPTAPLGFYGKSKLAGENALRGADVPYAIVRTQVLYGTAAGVRPNFVTFVLERLRAGGNLPVVDDQRGMPTLADDLARAISRIIQLRKEGIFHVSGRDSVSRFEFACEIARQFGDDPARILPIKTADLTQQAPRPPDSTFSLEKTRRELSFLPRGISAGLKEFRQQWGVLQVVRGGETG